MNKINLSSQQIGRGVLVTLDECKPTGLLHATDELRQLIMERHPDWFERRAFKDGYPYYYGLKLRDAV